MPDPRIRFKDNALVALEGSVGYSIGSARVELEIGYEQFKTRGIRDTGSKEEEADTVYLLAKKLPHTLVSDQHDEFKKLLGETTAKDIVALATAVGSEAKDIGKGVCKRTNGSSCNSQACAVPADMRCDEGENRADGGHARTDYQSKTYDITDRYTNVGLNANTKQWPGEEREASVKMAGDLSKLPRTDRNKIAGLLSKTISGGEVVENN